MGDGTIGKLPEKIAPPLYYCGTYGTGWLNDSHPEEPGHIRNATACFHYQESICYFSTNIQIRHCGPYFLYLLPNTAACNLRYCSERQIDQ